jgi:TonB family protein
MIACMIMSVNMMRLIGLLLAVVLQLTELVSSALAASPSVDACMSINDDARRLECLDRANGRVEPSTGTVRTSPVSSRTSGESAPSLEARQPDPMLDCARLTDLSKKLRCFDRVKSSSPAVAEPDRPSQRQLGRQPMGGSLEANRAGTSSAMDSAPIASRSKKKDSAEILSDYALEVVRQLGKEMLPEEYPVHAREHGIGGTVQALLRIGADGGIADVTVARSSDNEELDHYVVDKLSNLRLPRVPAEFRARAFAVLIPVKFAVRKN